MISGVIAKRPKNTVAGTAQTKPGRPTRLPYRSRARRDAPRPRSGARPPPADRRAVRTRPRSSPPAPVAVRLRVCFRIRVFMCEDMSA
ncbi:hypothetical protein GCM10010273_41660 [Streptomyces lavendulocolor]